MPLNQRDIWIVIRARDQASNIIRGMAQNATAETDRMSRKIQAQQRQTAIQMASVRNAFGHQLLQMRERELVAQRAGRQQEAALMRRAIQDMKLIRDQEVLNLQQHQIAQRQKLQDIQNERLRRRELIESRMEMVRTGGAMVAIGGAAAIAGVMGIKALHSLALGAAEYERQAALTATQVHTQEVAVQDLMRISNNVAQSVGTPLNRMQAALYDIFSSTDIRVEQSESVLRDFAKAAVAGQVDIQVAGRATISMMNAFGVPVEQVNRLLDVQFEAVRLGSMTYEEFASTVGRAIPAVRNSSQSIEFLAGSAAFLTRNGLNAAMAMTSIARGSEMFLRKPVQKNLREMGIEALTASGRLRPINEILTEMAPHFAGLDDMARKRLFEKIFGGQNFAQARRFFDLAIIKSAELNRFIRDVTASTGAFGDAYRRMAATTAVQTELLRNNWEIFKNALGAEVMPQLNQLIQWSTKFLVNLNTMEPSRKKLIADFLLWGSVGTTVIGVLTALSGVIIILNAGFKLFALWIGTAGTALTGLVARSALATTAVTALGGASATATTALGGLAIAIGVAAVANDALAKSQEAGASIHHKYIRPFWEFIGVVDKGTGARIDALRSMSDERAAMREGQLSAQAAGQSLDRLADSNSGLIPPMKQVIQLTEEQKKAFQQIADEVTKSGLQAYAQQQDRVKDATQRLAEAQADLARIQGGSVPTAKSLSAAEERIHDASVRVEKAQLSLADKTKDSRLEHIRLREAQHDLARAQEAGRASNSSSAGSADTLANAVQRVKDAQKALKEATGLTAAEVQKQFRDTAEAARNWSKNMRTLISKGMDPDLIVDLAREGPLHVAKFVSLSKKQIASLNQDWRAKKRDEAKVNKILYDLAAGDVAKYQRGTAKSNEKVRSDHAAKMRAIEIRTRQAMIRAGESVAGFRWRANSELTKLHGVKKRIDFWSTFKFPKEFPSIHSIVGATGGYVTPGGIIRRMSRGGMLDGPGTSTSDSIPARLSKGEYVVNAKAVRAVGRDFLDGINSRKVRGFATGGAVDYDVKSFNIHRYIGRIQSGIGRMADMIEKFAEKNWRLPMFTGGAGGGAPGGKGTGGTIGFAAMAWRVFQRVFGLPMGGWRAHGSVPGSDHPKGKAIDIMTSNRALHAAIIALGKQLPGAKYWISYRQIAQASQGWKPHYYGGPSPHTDHVHWSFYDRGGKLRPGWTMAWNGTGRDETVLGPGDAGVTVIFNGPVYGADSDQLANEVQKALLRKKRNQGGIKLGLT